MTALAVSTGEALSARYTSRISMAALRTKV
jgi:hypothetical protein